MILQINAPDARPGSCIHSHTARAVKTALANLSGRAARVEVHVREKTKHVTIQALLAERWPLAIDHTADDLYRSVSEAADMLARAAQTEVQRQEILV